MFAPASNVAPGRSYSLNAQAGGGTWYYDPQPGDWREFQSPSSGYTGSRPRSRLIPAFAYSTRDHVAVMFGGATYNDTWGLDAITKSWVQLRPDGAAGSPPRRGQVTNSMVYDSRNDVFILFGGRCANAAGCNGVVYGRPLNDTWIYRVSTNTWTRVATAAAPSPRDQHTLSFDEEHGVVVLMGGYTASGASNEVWTFDAAQEAWSQASSTPAPGGRFLHGAAYDPAQRAHVIYGGNSSSSTSAGGAVWSFTLAPAAVNATPIASFLASPIAMPAPVEVHFDASTSHDTDGTIVGFAWDFGDGTSATGMTATHTFTVPGSYIVTLTVTDNGGATATATSVVTAVAPNAPPVARIELAPSGPASFAFDASQSSDADGTIVAYAWDFGDGAVSTDPAPDHTFAPGSYTVTLTITDDQGATGTASTVVSVLPPNTLPEPRIVVQPGSAGVFDFDASGSTDVDGTIVAYLWDFGDGATGNGPAVQHSFAPGSYIVTLTVRDDRDGVASASVSITVEAPNAPPVAQFQFVREGPLTFSFDASASSDTDGTLVSFAWDLGDGTSGTGPTVQHTYASAGVYTVTLSVTDDRGATATAAQSVGIVIINVAPVARIVVTASAPDTFDFSGSASSDSDGVIAAYQWQFGDGDSATGENVSHRYLVPGTYTVELLVVDDGGLSHAAQATVTVIAAEPPQILLSRKISGLVPGGTVVGVMVDGIAVPFTQLPDGAFEFVATANNPRFVTVEITATRDGHEATSTLQIEIP